MTPITAAEFTSGTKRRPATLDITVIDNGDRRYVATHTVAGRAAARALAKALGATPWNF